jgi:hypothetical protein
VGRRRRPVPLSVRVGRRRRRVLLSLRLCRYRHPAVPLSQGRIRINHPVGPRPLPGTVLVRVSRRVSGPRPRSRCRHSVKGSRELVGPRSHTEWVPVGSWRHPRQARSRALTPAALRLLAVEG